MHPVVIYFKKDGVLHHISMCIISDDLEHDTCFVHELQIKVMLYIKENLPYIKSVDHFSDGCDGQYKNYKAFLSLCHHKSDFEIDAAWAFFATNHGKSPCDGIGSTVKRKILRASLQIPLNPLNANPEKLSNTLKQIVGNLPTICLSVSDHFMNLALKGLIIKS